VCRWERARGEYSAVGERVQAPCACLKLLFDVGGFHGGVEFLVGADGADLAVIAVGVAGMATVLDIMLEGGHDGIDFFGGEFEMDEGIRFFETVLGYRHSSHIMARRRVDIFVGKCLKQSGVGVLVAGSKG
jgi:hypothetical protein